MATATNASLIDLMRTIAAIPFVDAPVRSRASVLALHFEGKDPLREMFGAMGFDIASRPGL